MTKEIVEYLASVDGLRYIVDAFGDSADMRITLSMVFNKPFSFEKVKK